MSREKELHVIMDTELIEILVMSRTTAVPSELLTEIGRIVANFAILENELFILIHWLLGSDREISHIVTAELSFRNLLDLSASLVRQVHGTKAAKNYKEALKFATKAEDERNHIIHSLWGMRGLNATRIKHTAKRGKGHSIQREQLTQEDLFAVAIEISRAIFAVERFRESLGYPWTS
jgi:hypothetical protein